MSFSEETDRLLRLVDGGVLVARAAVEVGISKTRAYALLRAAGRGRGSRTRITDEHRRIVVEVFGQTSSVNRAAIVAGLSHSAARRILVVAGLVSADKKPARGRRPEAKARFLDLLAQGWSSARAAREVGVNVRTARDWRQGIRRSGNTRVYPDGRVVDYATGNRYTRTVVPSPIAISARYLSLDERLAIADGLVNKHTLTQIAADIGRNKATVSREVGAHSVEGVYLPHQAHRDAAAARARPKTSKLVVDTALREQSSGGWSGSCHPSRSRTG